MAYVRTTTASAFKASASVSTLPSAASTPKTYSSSGSDTVASSRDRRTRTLSPSSFFVESSLVELEAVAPVELEDDASAAPSLESWPASSEAPRRARPRRKSGRGGARRDDWASAVEERGVGRDELRRRDAKLVAIAEHFGDSGHAARQLAR